MAVAAPMPELAPSYENNFFLGFPDWKRTRDLFGFSFIFFIFKAEPRRTLD
jgi:hypothetical protein